MSDSQLVRELKIKTAAVKRLTAEVGSYIKEAEMNKTQIDKLKADPNADAGKLKQWEIVYAETQSMIPNSRDRLRVATEDLSKFLSSPPVQQQFAMSEPDTQQLWAEANTMLQNAILQI